MLGLASGVANSRVVRGAVIGIKGNPYFEAAHAIGSPSWQTLLRHVWPNITAPIIIIYSIHDRLGDHRGGVFELSGVRAAAGRAELGDDAEP